MSYGHGQMGFELNLGQILGQAGQTALDQLKVDVAKAALSDKEVQQSIKQAGVQTGANKLATWIVENPGLLIGGMLGAIGLAIFLVARK